MWVEAIVQQIIKWAFGYFNIEKQEWRTYLDSITYLARNIISFTRHGYSISTLVAFLKDKDLGRHCHHDIAIALGKIAVVDRIAIDALILLMENSSLDKNLYSSVANALSKIAVGDKVAIDALILLMENSSLDKNLYSSVADALSEIAIKDKVTIDYLTQMLQQNNWSIINSCEIATVLGKIDFRNRVAIDYLSNVLLQRNSDDFISREYNDCLSEVDEDYHAIGDHIRVCSLPFLLQDNYTSKAFSGLTNIAIQDRVTIDSFINLLKDNNLKASIRYSIVEVLCDIAVGDRSAIDYLVQFLQSSSSWSDKAFIAELLGQIDIGSKESIDCLIEILKRNDINWGKPFCTNVVAILGQIGTRNTDAILFLTQLLQQKDFDTSLRLQAIEAVGEIEELYPGMFETFIQLLQQPGLDTSFHKEVAKVLMKNTTKKEMLVAVQQLKYFISNSFCYQILIHYSQFISYQEFYAAWNTNFFNPQTLQQKLNRPHVIVLDIATFNDYSITEIPQKLSNIIHSRLAIPIPSTPKMNTLRHQILSLKLQPSLVLILYHSDSSTHFFLEMSKLAHPPKILILWINNDIENINTRFRMFFHQSQPDLAIAIQNAILYWRG